jgi:hypothetical protein
MRICGAFALAALIVATPLGGLAQAQQLNPPVGDSGNLLEGREFDWFLSKPESFSGGGFEAPYLYGPKRPSPEFDGLTGGLEPKRVPTIQIGQASGSPSASAGCEVNWFFLNPAWACFGVVRRPDFRRKGPMGDFWWPSEFDRLMGRTSSNN